MSQDWRKDLPAVEQATDATSARVRFQVLTLAGGEGTVIEHATKPWSSLSFAGTRHELVLRFESAAAAAGAEAMIDALPEHEFCITGQLVADASVREVNYHYAGDTQSLDVRAVLLLLEED